MCPGAGRTVAPAAPLPWVQAEAPQSVHCHADALPARPPPVGPLMTLRAGWRLGQANYMASSPPRPNNYTATCTERVANCVTSCEGRARAPLELMSFPQSPWGRARVRGCGRQALPIPSPPWCPAPGMVTGRAGRRGAVIKSQSSPHTCLLLPSLAQSRTWSGTMGLALSGAVPHTPPSPQGGSDSFELAFLPLALAGRWATVGSKTQSWGVLGHQNWQDPLGSSTPAPTSRRCGNEGPGQEQSPGELVSYSVTW